MAKSFLQSLPSHRRKKGRHYTRRGGGSRGRHDNSTPPEGAPASLPSQEQPPSQPSQQQSPESVVEETQVPFPPPRRRAWAERFVEEETKEPAENDADNDVDSHRGEEQLPSQRSAGEAPGVQLPPTGRDNPSLAAAEAGGARRVSADGPGGEPRQAPEEQEEGQGSPVQASLPIKAEPDDDDVFDAETVMESPVAGRGGVGVAAYLGRGATLPPPRAPEGRAAEPPRRAPEEGPAAQEEEDEQQDDVGREDGGERVGGENSSMRGERGLERDRSLETDAASSSHQRAVGSGGDALEAGSPGRRPTRENRDRHDEGKQSSELGPTNLSEGGETLRAEPEEKGASENRPDDSRSQSSETLLDVGADGDPMDGAGVPSVDAPGATTRVDQGFAEEVEAPGVEHNRGGKKTEGDEIELSTSDIRGCVMATRVAKDIMEADLTQDPFDGIDIERWQSVFDDFGSYLTTLGDETSEEAEELKQIGALDRVFAIFDRGMDVNHCNAVFIYGMIRTMVGGLEAYGKSHSQGVANRPSRREAFDGCKKLHHLASCLNVIFGVTEESDACPVAVSVGRAERDNATVLALSFEPNLDGETPLARVAAVPSTLSPHLHAMNQVFAKFVADRTRALQSQLDSTQKTLAATRDGAMDLQRRALKVQDDLQAAEAEAEEAASKRETAEAELETQRYEFERKEESFERVKEHLKAEIGRKEAELAETKQKYQRALDEANAKHERAKQMYTEQKLELEEARRSALSERRSTGRKNIEQISVCGFIGTAGKAGATERRSIDHSRDTERKSTAHKGTDKRKRGSDREVEPRRSEHSKHLGMKHRPDARDPAEESGADDQISPSLPRNIFCDSQVDPYDAGSILGDPWECGSRKRSKMSDRKDRHSGGNAASSKKHSAPFELAPPRRSRSLSEPRSGYASHRMDRTRAGSGRRSDERRGELGERGGSKRNPLKSLADNGAESDEDRAEKKASRHRRERSTTRDRHDRSDRDRDRESRASNVAASSTKQTSVKNPYLKPPKSAKTTAKATSEPSFAFQEVVRGKKDREALPGHECEECKRFMDAVGRDYDRDALVQGCSRHRSRCAPPLTPPGFWNLTFVDSVSSNNKSDIP
ncbi:hypothetical protein ACHAXT_010119 [Thalassiosira profunda]